MSKSKFPFQLTNFAFIFLSVNLLWMPAHSPAESIQLTTLEQIDIAKQIYYMEEIAAAGNSETIAILANYLDAPYSPLARIAARQLTSIGTGAAKAALIAHNSEPSNVSILVGLAKLNASSRQEATNNQLLLLNDPDITPGHRSLLEDEIATLLSAEDWLEELELYFNDSPHTTYSEIRSNIRNMSILEKRIFLENILLNFNSPFEYEAAIRLIVEEIKTDEIPFILESLQGPAYIPSSTPPPFERLHTVYQVLILVLESIPDQRSIPILTILSQNSNEYVSEKASEALIWVRSNIPFPIRYWRLLLQSDEG